MGGTEAVWDGLVARERSKLVESYSEFSEVSAITSFSLLRTITFFLCLQQTINVEKLQKQVWVKQ